jgi:hypothetical protein
LRDNWAARLKSTNQLREALGQSPSQLLQRFI